MSDDEQQGPLVVWGIPVPRKSNGRNMWPARIKAMAAQRFMAGHTVAAIAREVTANESLVGKWITTMTEASDSSGGIRSCTLCQRLGVPRALRCGLVEESASSVQNFSCRRIAFCGEIPQCPLA